MPWEPAEEDSLVPSAFLKKAKLYADEDIEEELVGFLRAKGANIKSARELGHHRRPDEFHANLAFKQKRFLLTKNGKHFLDDGELPMHRTYGVIAIEGDMAYLERYGLAALHLFRMIVPYGELLEGSKISLSASGLSLQRQPKCGPANSPKTDPV